MQVAQIQRARILAAMFDVASEMGAANVSVAHVVERSGVSRRTFYETFSDREDCFLAAFEDALAFASRRVLPAYEAGRRWRDRIRAAVIALLSFLDEEPVIGRLLICESLSGGAKTRMRREQVLAQIAGAIDEGRILKGIPKGHAAGEGSASTATLLGPLTAEGLVGGALSILDARLSLSSEPPLIGMANVLISMIVLPYLGSDAACRELERPVEPRVSDHRDARLSQDPFKGAGMRLTYRTVRVLLAVAEHSGASNRLIAETAGMSDQGQISKLLGRLQRLGLIANTGRGPGRGGPNAWSLTAVGRGVVHSLSPITESVT